MRIGQAVATEIHMGRYGAKATKPMATLSKQSVGDRVELSVSKSTINALPDVRMDRLEAVRARLESGFYDRQDVREGIADAFLRHSIR